MSRITFPIKYFFWNSTINPHQETVEGVSFITIGAMCLLTPDEKLMVIPVRVGHL
jgi:hypothetical protein